MPYRCRERECAKRFSVRTKTPMESSKLSFQVWAIALYQLTTNFKSVSSMKLHRDLGITQKSAWFLAHRLREAWKDHGAQLSGPVEVDEMYMGGLRENMPKAKRKTLKGRGAVGKTVVAGAKDRATNRISATVVDTPDKRTMHRFVKERSAPGAKVYTDDYIVYRGIPRDHDTVRHADGEHVRGDAHAQGIASFWPLPKRAHKGTFHKISAKHMQRHVNECFGKHNVRTTDTIDQMSGVVTEMNGRRLTYSDLVSGM